MSNLGKVLDILAPNGAFLLVLVGLEKNYKGKRFLTMGVQVSVS